MSFPVAHTLNNFEGGALQVGTVDKVSLECLYRYWQDFDEPDLVDLNIQVGN